MLDGRNQRNIVRQLSSNFKKKWCGNQGTEKLRGLPKVTALYSKEPRLQPGPADANVYVLSAVHSHCPPYQLGISLSPVSANGASRHDVTSGSKAPLIPLKWFLAYLAEILEEGHSAGQGAGAPF